MSNSDVFGRQADEVRAIFGDLEIVEAKADFIVYVTADEQKNSKRGDPNNCMFSTACKRAFGAKGVLFFPTVAYVDMVDPDDPSQRIVMRFMLPQKTRARLEEFDAEDAGASPEATFILKAVPKSNTLAAVRKSQRKRDSEKRRLALLGAATEPSERHSRASKKGHVTRRSKALMGIRSGAGQVHTRDGEVTD